MRKIFAFALFALVALIGAGQTVSDVDAYQEGKTIVVTYHTDKAGTIDAVYCSTDGGRTWGEPLRSVTGDVGKRVPAGEHRIVWDVLADREKLTGSNICFKVEANAGRYTVNGVTFDMVRVDGGTFRMGATSEQGSDTDSDEKPVHSVTLDSYYIGKTEVTQALWKAVMGSNPSNIKGAAVRSPHTDLTDLTEFF